MSTRKLGSPTCCAASPITRLRGSKNCSPGTGKEPPLKPLLPNTHRAAALAGCLPITELVDTSYHHAASESPTFGHSRDPEKAALGGGIPLTNLDVELSASQPPLMSPTPEGDEAIVTSLLYARLPPVFDIRLLEAMAKKGRADLVASITAL